MIRAHRIGCRSIMNLFTGSDGLMDGDAQLSAFGGIMSLGLTRKGEKMKKFSLVTALALIALGTRSSQGAGPRRHVRAN